MLVLYFILRRSGVSLLDGIHRQVAMPLLIRNKISKKNYELKSNNSQLCHLRLHKAPFAHNKYNSLVAYIVLTENTLQNRFRIIF